MVLGASTTRNTRHALVVAYYFPPLGLSGVQRVAKLVKYLPEHGWDVTVITVEPGAYFAFDDKLASELERPGIHIHRARTLDPTRRSAGRRVVAFPGEAKRRILSRITQWFFLPDNKRGWKKHALNAFYELSSDAKYDVVFASAPPYTSFLVGSALAQRAHIPLFLDYRDDWIENPRHSYPTAFHRWLQTRMEQRAAKASSGITVINDVIGELLSKRLPEATLHVIPQGYDPQDFAEGGTWGTAESISPTNETKGKIPSDHERRIRFLYTGIFYDAQRPDVFLEACAQLLHKRPELRSRFEARFVGLEPEQGKALCDRHDLQDVVHFTGYLDHERTIREMKDADVLWMTIGHQKGGHMISTGKLFEYFGSRKPILALVPKGTAAEALKRYGAGWICDPDDVTATLTAMEDILFKLETDSLPKPDEAFVEEHDRYRLAGQVARLFESCL